MRLDLPTRRTLGAVMTALVVIAAIPAAFMVGCNMPMPGTSPTDCVGHSLTIGQTLSQACSGITITTHGVEGLAANSVTLLLLVAAAALAAVVLMRAAESRERAYVFVPIEPPPPPEDPLGTRLTL